MVRAYVALLGRSVWATLNAYYSVVYGKGYYPDRVWLVTEKRYEDDLTSLKEGVGIISGGFSFTPKIETIVTEEGDVVEAGIKVGKLIESLKPSYEVALDVTSARKAVVVGTILATTNCKPDHIYYLMIDNLDDAAKPYPMIPFVYQHIQDFREQMKGSVP
jgi:hypothetical protein